MHWSTTTPLCRRKRIDGRKFEIGYGEYTMSAVSAGDGTLVKSFMFVVKSNNSVAVVGEVVAWRWGRCLSEDYVEIVVNLDGSSEVWLSSRTRSGRRIVERMWRDTSLVFYGHVQWRKQRLCITVTGGVVTVFCLWKDAINCHCISGHEIISGWSWIALGREIPWRYGIDSMLRAWTDRCSLHHIWLSVSGPSLGHLMC